MDIDKITPSDNLLKLRVLVDNLENKEIVNPDYNDTLRDIEKVIKNEKKIISSLKKPDAKLRHYETICTSILSLISTNP